MELLDLPASVLTWIDRQAAVVFPPVVRLVLWGVAGAVVSMSLYRVLSPQDRIARCKLDIRQARRDLDRFDGEFTEAIPLIKRLLKLSLRQVGRVGWPAMAASLPLLVLLVWLNTEYGHKTCLPFGPAWARGWEPTFFLTLVLVSMIVKVAGRIE